MNIRLLKEVKKVILANYKNYNQRHYCGSAVCICGWAVAIAEEKSINKKRSSITEISQKGKQYLGLTDEQAEFLFDPLFVSGFGGTREYARKASRQITKFIKENV